MAIWLELEEKLFADSGKKNCVWIEMWNAVAGLAEHGADIERESEMLAFK